MVCCVYLRVFAIEVFYDIFLNGQTNGGRDLFPYSYILLSLIFGT